MIKLYLEQQGNKAGDYTIELKEYDDATAATGKWDEATCTKNAGDHVGNTDEVAVMGTFNSSCAKLEVPILNQDPDGPMLMVSHANTNVGLTKTWEPGEPDKFYPTGSATTPGSSPPTTSRASGRAVLAAKDLEGEEVLRPQRQPDLRQGVAKAFVNEAKKQGIKILGNEPWDAKQPNYTALFQKIKATDPDCIFLGGIYDNNGGQLVKDKVEVLGDNTDVVTDGPGRLHRLPGLAEAAAGARACTSPSPASTRPLRRRWRRRKLLRRLQGEVRRGPATELRALRRAAVQVILAAIAKSDGTRKGITDQVFGGAGSPSRLRRVGHRQGDHHRSQDR